MTEGKRFIIFVGVLSNVLLLTQSVTSTIEADPGIDDFRIISRIRQKFDYPNCSITNQREFERHRSDLSRFRSEPPRRIFNAPTNPAYRFSFTGTSEENIQLERQRRIIRERRSSRQERNRAIMNDQPLQEHIPRKSMETNFDNSRYFRYSEAPSDRSIRKSPISLRKSIFSNSESIALLSASNNRNRRIDSRSRDTRNFELLFRTRGLKRNADDFRNRRTRSMRNLEANRDQNFIRVMSRNSDTSSSAHSWFASTLSQYLPYDSIPSPKSYQINDFVVSTIAAIILYDMMGAMLQNKAVAVKKESFGNFVEKIVFAIRKMAVP